MPIHSVTTITLNQEKGHRYSGVLSSLLEVRRARSAQRDAAHNPTTGSQSAYLIDVKIAKGGFV
jgi:hypothetical protein